MPKTGPSLSAHRPAALPAGCLSVVVALVAFALPSKAEALTLREAIQAAEASQENVQIAQARVDQARAARWNAYTVLFPRASATGVYRRRAREIVRDVGGDEVVIQRFNALSGSLNADLRMFDAAAYSRIVASRHALDAAREDARWVRRELWFEVTESYVSVIASEELAEAAEQRVKRAELYESAAQRRLDAGLANKNDATRATLELATARTERTRVENAARSARLSLGYLIDGEVPDELTLPEQPLLAEVPEQELVQRARALRPDVRAQLDRVQEAEALAREPWLRFVPVIDGGGAYMWTNEPSFNGRSTNWNLAITATWVAFDGGSRIAAAAEQRASLRARELELAALKRRIRFEVRLALNDLASAIQGLEQAETQREVADLNRGEVSARFDRGLADALSLADAAQQAYEAQAEVARQALALRMAEIAVLRAVGDFTGEVP